MAGRPDARLPRLHAPREWTSSCTRLGLPRGCGPSRACPPEPPSWLTSSSARTHSGRTTTSRATPTAAAGGATLSRRPTSCSTRSATAGTSAVRHSTRRCSTQSARWACASSNGGCAWLPRPPSSSTRAAARRESPAPAARGGCARRARRGLPPTAHGLGDHGRRGGERVGIHVAGDRGFPDGRRPASAHGRMRHRRFHVLARPARRGRVGGHRRCRGRLRSALLPGNRDRPRDRARTRPRRRRDHQRGGIRSAVRVTAGGAPRPARGVRDGGTLARLAVLGPSSTERLEQVALPSSRPRTSSGRRAAASVRRSRRLARALPNERRPEPVASAKSRCHSQTDTGPSSTAGSP